MAGVKKRSGGARVGAGGKPLSAQDRWLRGKPAGTHGIAVVPETGAVRVGGVVVMPDDLPAPVVAQWMRLAPLAVKEGTLTEMTAPGFQVLCALMVLEVELSADVDKRAGADHRGVLQRVETMLARFRLTGDGRQHAAPAAKDAPKSPLELLQEQAAAMRRPIAVSKV